MLLQDFSESINTYRTMAQDSIHSLPNMKISQSREERYTPSLRSLQGNLLKKRRFPSKGWIKRFFSLQDGILKYAVSQGHASKLKYHGIYDLGCTTIVFYSQVRRFDIDSESGVCHVKCKTHKEYEEWSLALRKHRMYRIGKAYSHDESIEDLQKKVLRARASSIQNNNTLANWIVNSDYFIKDFKSTLDEAKSQLCTITKSNSTYTFDSVSTPLSNEQKSKDFSRSLKKSSSKSHKNRKIPSPPPVITNRNSVPDIESKVCFDDTHLNSPFAYSDTALHVDTTFTAETVCNKLYELIDMLERQQQELKIALQQESEKYTHQRVLISNLRMSLNEALTQNTEYRERLNRIRKISNPEDDTRDFDDERDSDMHTLPIIEETQEWFNSHNRIPIDITDNTPSPLELSRQTSCISSSIFFDAYEETNSSIPYYDADHGHESSDELDEMLGDSENDNSDSEMINTTPTASGTDGSDEAVVNKTICLRKRGTLPSPRPDIGGLSLWSILRKNIGKDLSRISMPVALNEPLSALQRLSEELEYSELIEKACRCDDPFDRMLYVAAFALSPYSTSYYRAGQKVFNPILGETYELIDEERGFKFIAEQVSHHPPESACNAESSNYMFWEDARLKYKFWGQSMELYPTGTINLQLLNRTEHYTWSKVTTCVHNVLNFQSRWIENYGDMLVSCTSTGVTCNIILSKNSYFSSKKYDIKGDVFTSANEKVRHLFGMLKEGIYSGSENGEYTCIWRPNQLPSTFENFYGFSYFAIELNYLPEEMKEFLPISDSRYRTDQRLLENGNLAEAEEEKKRIEQIQRDSRAIREEHSEEWVPNFFEKQANDSWIYKQNYFSARDEKFSNLEIPNLW